MSNKIIDTHFHSLSLKQREVDVIKLLSDAYPNSLYSAVDVAIECDDFESRYEYLKDLPFIKYSVGAGPWGLNNKTVNENRLTIVDTLKIHSNKINFIGEIGLDYFHKEYKDKDEQKNLFVSEIEIANEFKKPIIVHTREAVQDTCDILNTVKVKKGGIIHCFSANNLLLKTALDNDFYISFALPITYKKSTSLREIVKYVPQDRLLLETDSPFLPPEGKRGETNTPLNVIYGYKTICEILNIDLEELCKTVEKNYEEIIERGNELQSYT